MRRVFSIVALAFAITLCAVPMRGWGNGPEKEEGKEQKVKFDQLPGPVQKTLADESKGAKIDEVDKETEDGKTTYEVDVKINGKNYEIKVAEDGTLISKKLDMEDEKEEQEGKSKK